MTLNHRFPASTTKASAKGQQVWVRRALHSIYGDTIEPVTNNWDYTYTVYIEFWEYGEHCPTLMILMVDWSTGPSTFFRQSDAKRHLLDGPPWWSGLCRP